MPASSDDTCQRPRVCVVITTYNQAPYIGSALGTYGRFRIISGTDQVVLINAIEQNVLIGTLP